MAGRESRKPVRARISAFASLIALVAGFSLPALSQTPLVCGEASLGSISSPGETDFYAFGATAGDVVTLRAAGPIGPVMELYSPAGARLGAALGRLDATLQTTGIYTITVSRDING
ncbi:MAG: hypothetical protein ACREUU_14820, partial [Gammaproteobacteria bacterium]